MKYVICIILSAIVGSSALLPSVAPVVATLTGKLPLLLGVLLAAVFVRLARGLPSMPFDKVDASRALLATRAFRHLIKAYVQTLAVFITAIALNIVYSSLPPVTQFKLGNSVLVIVLFIDCLVLASLCFLVNSDIHLSMTQADMVDHITNEASSRSAFKSVDTVKNAFQPDERQGPSVS